MRSFDLRLFIDWMRDFKVLSTISNLYIRLLNIEEKINKYQPTKEKYFQRFFFRPFNIFINGLLVIALAIVAISYILFTIPFSYKNFSNGMFLISKISSLVKDTLKNLISELLFSKKSETPKKPIAEILDKPSNYGLDMSGLPSLKDIAAFFSYSEQINAIQGLDDFLKTVRIKTGNLQSLQNPADIYIQPEEGFSGYDFLNFIINQQVSGITTDHFFYLINQAIYYTTSHDSEKNGQFQETLVRLLSIAITGTSNIPEAEQKRINNTFKEFFATLSRGYGEKPESQINKIPFNSGQILRAVSPELLLIAKNYPHSAKPLINFILCTVYNYNQYNTQPAEKKFVSNLLDYALANFSAQKISDICQHLGHSDVISFLRDIVYDENILKISKLAQSPEKTSIEKAIQLKEMIDYNTHLRTDHPLSKKIITMLSELKITTASLDDFIKSKQSGIELETEPDFDKIFNEIQSTLSSLSKKDYVDQATIKFLQANIDGAALFIDRSLITSLDGDTSFFNSDRMIETHLKEEEPVENIDSEDFEGASDNPSALSLTHYDLKKEKSLKDFIKIILNPEIGLTGDFLLSLANIDKKEGYISKTGSIMQTIANRFRLSVNENPLPFLNEHTLTIEAIQKFAGTDELFLQLSLVLKNEKTQDFFSENNPDIEENLESTSVLISLLLTQILNLQSNEKDHFTAKENLEQLSIVMKSILRSKESRNLIASILDLIGSHDYTRLSFKEVVINSYAFIRILALSESIPENTLELIFNRILESQRPVIKTAIEQKIKKTREKIERIDDADFELLPISQQAQMETNSFFINLKEFINEIIQKFKEEDIEINEDSQLVQSISQEMKNGLKPSHFASLLDFLSIYQQPINSILSPESQSTAYLKTMSGIFLESEKIDHNILEKNKEEILKLHEETLLKTCADQREIFLTSLRSYPEVIESINSKDYSIDTNEFLLSSEKANALPIFFNIQNYNPQYIQQYHSLIAANIISKKTRIEEIIAKIKLPELESLAIELTKIPSLINSSAEDYCQQYLESMIKIEQEFISKIDTISLQKKIISSLVFEENDVTMHQSIVSSLNTLKSFLFNETLIKKMNSEEMAALRISLNSINEALDVFDQPISAWDAESYAKTKPLFDSIHFICKIYLDEIDNPESLIINEDGLNQLLAVVKNIYDILEIKNKNIEELFAVINESYSFEEKKSFIKTTLHLLKSCNETTLSTIHPSLFSFLNSLSALDKTKQDLKETTFKLAQLKKKTSITNTDEMAALELTQKELFSRNFATHASNTHALLTSIGTIANTLHAGDLQQNEHLKTMITASFKFLVKIFLPESIDQGEKALLTENISTVLTELISGAISPDIITEILNDKNFSQDITLALYGEQDKKYEAYVRIITLLIQKLPEFKEALLNNILKLIYNRDDFQGNLLSTIIKMVADSQKEEIKKLISAQIKKNKNFMESLNPESASEDLESAVNEKMIIFQENFNSFIDEIIKIFGEENEQRPLPNEEELKALLSTIGSQLSRGLLMSDFPSFLKLINIFKKETLEILTIDSPIGLHLKEIAKIFLQTEQSEYSVYEEIKPTINMLKSQTLLKDAEKSLTSFNRRLEAYPEVSKAIEDRNFSVSSGQRRLLNSEKINSLSTFFSVDQGAINHDLEDYYKDLATKISAKKSILLELINKINSEDLASIKTKLLTISLLDMSMTNNHEDFCKNNLEKMIDIEQEFLSKWQSLMSQKKIIFSLIFEEPDADNHKNLVEVLNFCKEFLLNDDLIQSLNTEEIADLKQSIDELPKALGTFGQPFLEWSDQTWNESTPLFDTIHLIGKVYLVEIEKEDSSILTEENIDELLSVIEKINSFLELNDEDLTSLIDHIKTAQSFDEKKEVLKNLLHILNELNPNNLSLIQKELSKFLKTSAEIDEAKQNMAESSFKLEKLSKKDPSSEQLFTIQSRIESDQISLVTKLPEHKQHLHSLLNRVGLTVQSIGGEHLANYFNTPEKLKNLMSSVIKVLLKNKKPPMSERIVDEASSILANLISKTKNVDKIKDLLCDENFSNHLSSALNPQSTTDFGSYVKVVNDILEHFPELTQELSKQETYDRLIEFSKSYISESKSKSWLFWAISHDPGVINIVTARIIDAIKDGTLKNLAKEENLSLWGIGLGGLSSVTYHMGSAAARAAYNNFPLVQATVNLGQVAYEAPKALYKYAQEIPIPAIVPNMIQFSTAALSSYLPVLNRLIK